MLGDILVFLFLFLYKMSIFGAKIESSSSDNQTVLSPAGGLIQTSQGAAVDTSNPIKIQHNRVVLDTDDPFETQSNGKLGAKLESPVALYNGKIAVYYNTPLHNVNDHLTVLYNWPIEVGNDGKFYLKYHYPLNVDGRGFLHIGLNADSLQERNHNLEPVPTTYSYVGGTVMHNAPVSVRDFKTNGLTVNVKSDTEIEYTFLKKGIYELTGLHNNAIIFGTATSDTPNVCETLLTSYTYFLDVKDISKPVTLTLHNGVGSGVNFLFRVMQIDISRI